jgi:hypothetical protein
MPAITRLTVYTYVNHSYTDFIKRFYFMLKLRGQEIEDNKVAAFEKMAALN